MQVQFFFALVALLAIPLCKAAALPEPFTISFLQNVRNPEDWKEASETLPPDGDGESIYKDDPGYLGHYKFGATEDSLRKFIWQGAVQKDRECKVMISGDPKVKELRYHLHQRKFIVAEGDQPDLSAVHVRCNFPPVENGYRTPTTTKGGKPKDGTEGYVYQDAEVPDLIDTDFERTLSVVFQIIQWDHNQTAPNDNKESINLDFWLDKLPDKIAENDKGYQYELETEAGAILLHDAINLKYSDGEMSDEQKAWVDNEVWTGEVGRMAFTKSRESAREFTWTLHHVDGVLNSRKCRLNINYDLHTEFLYVHVDEGAAELSLDWITAGGPPWAVTNVPGDIGGASVECDAPVVEGAEPKTSEELDKDKNVRNTGIQ